MKNVFKIHFFALALLASFVLVSCQDKEEDPAPEPIEETFISEEEAAEVVTASVISNSQGIASEVADAAALADEYAEFQSEDEIQERSNACGQSFDTTVVRDIDKPNITANYTTNWAWTLNCEGLFPVSLDYSRDMEGIYETNRIFSDDGASSSWTLTNLITGPAYLFNGTYSRNGSQTSKIGNQNSFSSTVDITSTDIAFDKSEQEINSGTATFILTGQGTGGNTFSFEGSITFTGDQTATIIINGNEYPISW